MDSNGNKKHEEGGKNSLKTFIISPVGKVCLIFALYVIILGLTVPFISLLGSGIGFAIVMAVFAYFGWKALNRLTPNIFLIMPVGGWLIYYLVKFLLWFIIIIGVSPPHD